MKQIAAFIFCLIAFYGKSQLVNGDFQTSFTYGCNAGPGWTTSVGNGSEPEITDIFQTGNAWIDLTPCGAWGNGTWVEQTITTIPNHCYSVTFDLGCYCGWDGSDAGIYVMIDGVILGDRIVNDIFECTGSFLRWDTYTSETFVATSSSTTIRFTGEGRCTALSSPDGAYPCSPIGAIGNPGVIAFDNVILNTLGFSATTTELPDVHICPNQSATIGTTIEGVQYEWSTGQTTPTIVVNTPGTYTFDYISSCNIGTGTVEVIGIDAPPSISLGPDTLLCPPFQFLLSAASNNTIWSTGDISNTIVVSSPGEYYATATNICGSKSDTITVFSQVDFDFDVVDLTEICEGDTLWIHIPDQFNQILWQDGINTHEYSIAKSGEYFFSYFDGCDSNQENFRVEAQDCNCNFFIPNSFTANNDGINDVWSPYLDENCEFALEVYNRWGVKIFEMNSSDHIWTGGDSEGKYYVPDGVYTYRLTYKSNQVDWKEKVGTVCLIR